VRGEFEALVSDAEGRLEWKGRRNRTDLEVKARVEFSDEFTRDEASEGVTLVVFPDGTICELQSRLDGDDVRYRLRLREKRGNLRERNGTCTPAGIPEFAGGTVDIVHDGDGDPGTPNTTLLTGEF
jgi:hypothetical protein